MSCRSMPLFYPQACKVALRKLSPLINSAKVNKMFQQHLDPEESLLYGEFLNDLCKLIVSRLARFPRTKRDVQDCHRLF